MKPLYRHNEDARVHAGRVTALTAPLINSSPLNCRYTGDPPGPASSPVAAKERNHGTQRNGTLKNLDTLSPVPKSLNPHNSRPSICISSASLARHNRLALPESSRITSHPSRSPLLCCAALRCAASCCANRIEYSQPTRPRSFTANCQQRI